MSADLELRQQELLEIRLPPEMTTSEKASSQSSEITDEVDGIRSTTNSSSSGEQQRQGEEENNCQTPKTGKPSEKGSTSKKQEGEEEEESGQCRTPSSPGHMIPEILSCPPAPKKQRTSVVSCKRKLVFFDQVVARDEIDSFFRQFAIDVVNSKRRCLV